MTTAVADAHDSHDEHGPAKGIGRWLFSTNHKDIGTMYLVFSLTMFFIGGSMALVIRSELAVPGLQFVHPEFFNSMTTMHALIMVFGAVMPAFVGLANWMIPLMIGAPDMALPRMNNWSFWILPVAFGILLSTLLMPGGAPASGWTMYPPLVLQTGDAFPFLIFSVHLMGISSIMGAINVIVTIINMRAPEMTLLRMLSFAPEGVSTNVPGVPQPDKRPDRIESPAAAGAEGENENTRAPVDPVATGAAEGHQEAGAPSEPATVKDVELPGLQPTLPEASDDWYELVSALELAGVARMIVEHANLVEMRENGMVVRLDQAHDTLLNDNQVEVIRRAMSAQLQREIRLEVDGGVKIDNIAAVAAAGADTFVAGSAIFGSDDYRNTISRMKANVAGA